MTSPKWSNFNSARNKEMEDREISVVSEEEGREIQKCKLFKK